MSRSDQLFKWRTMKVPNRSGFNKSFQNLFTMPVGTLVPLLCDELLPNTNVKLSVLLSASLPPLASSTFMRCKLKAEAFFVPLRQLYGGFQSWYTQEKIHDTVTGNDIVPVLPIGAVSSSQNVTTLQRFFGPGSLADYLGYKFESSQIVSFSQLSPAVIYQFNCFPFLAYHWIYDHFYRNSQVTKPLFSRPFSGAPISVSSIPYQASSSNNNLANYSFPDNSTIFTLRQRNFDIDYFTSGTPQAQQGNPQSVTVVNNQFTIASLRASNSLQQMLERSNNAGFRLVDFVKAHFGAYLSDGQAQRPLYLGSGSFDVYSKGIYQNSENSGSTTNNPFNSVASEYGSAFAGGKIDLVDNFTASEPGYLFVMVSLVPRATYSTGTLAQLRHLGPSSTPAEMGFPALQNIGNQPIMASELNSLLAANGTDAVFAYTDRFAEYMTREDELHGLLRDGESLQSFALQRSGSSVITGGNTSISTLFLEIPQQYLDQVAAVNTGISRYGCWVDSYLDYKISMPLHQYSTPSLQDPAAEHGHTVKMERGGQKL